MIRQMENLALLIGLSQIALAIGLFYSLKIQGI